MYFGMFTEENSKRGISAFWDEYFSKELDRKQKMWDCIYREWLPGADYELIQGYDIEHYLPGDMSSKDYVSEIWIPVKEKR